MNFLALAMTILSMYAPVSGYSPNKNELTVLEQAALEEVQSDIAEYIKGETHVVLSKEFKSELNEFLRNHGANSSCNCKFLEIFLSDKIFESMVETTMEIYAPVSHKAGSFEGLTSADKNEVIRCEARIINSLRTKYGFTLDSKDRGDFIVFIRRHALNTRPNRELLKRFFSGTRTGWFERMTELMILSRKDKKVDATMLRQRLQADPNMVKTWNLQGKHKGQKQCHNLAVHRQMRVPRYGKNA